jgi:hypothetical protein
MQAYSGWGYVPAAMPIIFVPQAYPTDAPGMQARPTQGKHLYNLAGVLKADKTSSLTKQTESTYLKACS